MTPRLSPDRIEAAHRAIDPVFLNTPQFMSDALGAILMVETINPIRSFKGRGADLLMSTLPPGDMHLVCASAGNFGQAVAYCAREWRRSVTVFAAVSANPLKIERMRALGADVCLAGEDFDAAKAHALAFANDGGGMFIEDGREPAVTEGQGTIAVELCQWPEPLDVVVTPLGNGALLAGIGTYIKSRSPNTRVIGVCASGAPAMALSLRAGKAISTPTMSTFADGIGVRVPVPEALDDLAPVVDEILLVEDSAMLDAMRVLFRHHGLVTEPAGVAGVAALLSYPEKFQGAVVATPICGGNINPQLVTDVAR